MTINDWTAQLGQPVHVRGRDVIHVLLSSNTAYCGLSQMNWMDARPEDGRPCKRCKSAIGIELQTAMQQYGG